MYTPLYIKTDNSLLHSMIKIDDLIEYAVTKKIESLTITDFNMYGVIEFYQKCISNNIKPIIGLEVKYKELPFVLYAKNNQGYQNLTKLSTIISEINPTIDEIIKYSSNLICIIPFTSKPIFQELNKIYENIYVGYKNQNELNHLKGNNLVYMNEVLCLKKEDEGYLRYLKAIDEGKSIENVEDIYQNTSIKTFEYIQKNHPETIKNNQEIINMCNVKIGATDNLLPIYKCPNDLNSKEYLKKLCIDGLKKKFGSTTFQVYKERLKHELNIIDKMGFNNYFLVVWDYVNYARENNIFCHARGSAAGSLVAYLLNITDTDPIKYNLVFERFLNEYRLSMPDIDMDFEDKRREEVIDYCIKKYGDKKVAGIITFTTLKPKLVIRDVGRVLDIKPDIIDYICQLLGDIKNNSLKDVYKNNLKLKEYLKDKKDLINLYQIAIKLENLKKNTSSHAAGIVICNRDLDEVVPLEKNSNMYLTAYSMNYLEELGLLKMDFLGLRNLTTINNIIKDLNRNNIDIDFDSIPLNDQKTFDIFKFANTIGIFQFEKYGMRDFLKKLKPNCLEDLFAAIALYRPGPMDNINTYIKRKNGEKFDCIVKELETTLKKTYGIIIYQEQIIEIVNIMADYSLGEADIFRKAVSKKKDEVMLSAIEEFKKRALKKYSEEIVNKVSKLIVKFAEYGFNRSHSVAYSLLAYKLAYLKANYPAYFMRNIMSNSIGRSITTKDYIYECKINNIKILKPSINKSYKDYQVEDNNLRCPLNNIKNINIQVVDAILEQRKKGPYKDFYDFIKRMYSKTINKKIIQILINAGCFDEFEFNKRTLTNNIDEMINYGELLKDIDEEYALKPEIEIFKDYNKKELLELEYQSFGFYLSDHPVTLYKNKYHNSMSIKDIPTYFDKNIDLIVNVKKIKLVTTKKQEKMAFVTGEDESGNVDMVIFPRILSQTQELDEDSIILVKGLVEKRYDEYQVVINKINVLKI